MKSFYLREADANFLVITEDKKEETGTEIEMKKEIEKEINKEQTGEEYQMKMLEYNHLEELLPVQSLIVNKQTEYRYLISSKQCILTVFEKKGVTEDIIRKFIFRMEKLLFKIEEYLLSTERLILDAEYLYMDLTCYEIYFCYCPFYKGGLQEGLRKLLQFFMEKLDYRDKKGVVCMFQIHKAAMQPEFSFSELKSLIEPEKPEVSPADEKAEYIEDYSNPPIAQPEILEEKEIKAAGWLGTGVLIGTEAAIGVITAIICLTIMQREEVNQQAVFMKCVAALLLALAAGGFVFLGWRYFGGRTKIVSEESRLQFSEGLEEYGAETPVWEVVYREGKYKEEMDKEEEEKGEEKGTDETILLSAYTEEEHRRLVPIQDGMDEIRLINYPFILGRMKGQTDAVIDAEGVSRIHAKIDRNGENYYIYDLNSRNGIYINEKRARAGERQRIEQGDKIRIAAISYYFQ